MIMNKHYLKILITLVGIFIFALFALGSGSGESSNVSTGSNDSKSPLSGDQPFKVAVNYEDSFGGLSVKIGEIQIEEDRILVGMTIINNSGSKLSFYPDQGNAVVGNMQLGANMFTSEGDASGDILPEVQKSAVIKFDVPKGNALTPSDVKEVRLHFGNILNHDSYDSTECDITINIE